MKDRPIGKCKFFKQQANYRNQRDGNEEHPNNHARDAALRTYKVVLYEKHLVQPNRTSHSLDSVTSIVQEHMLNLLQKLRRTAMPNNDTTWCDLHHRSKNWLSEKFGNGHMDTFMLGIISAKNRKWDLSNPFSTLHSFNITEAAGLALIQLLRQRSLTSLKRKNTKEKTLGDMYNEAMSESQAVEKRTNANYRRVVKATLGAQSIAVCESAGEHQHVEETKEGLR
ncbi:MAG: hypothetical protein J3Q66DRAFT_423312 [Benniella sp.]|nr:MAG: hypothetical protein J3Q66DRAFT_423312 [Benniella sp.]